MTRAICLILALYLSVLVISCVQSVQPVRQYTVDRLRIEHSPNLILPNRTVVFTLNDTTFQGSGDPHLIWSTSDTAVRVEPIQPGAMKCSFVRDGQFDIHLNVFDSSTHQLIGTAHTSVLVGFPTALAIGTNPAHPHVGDSILFFVTGQDMTPFRLEWNLGDSIFQTTRNASFAARSFCGAGDYPISVRIFDSVGFVDSISATLHVSPVGGEFSLELLKQFTRVRIYVDTGYQMEFDASPVTWNLDTMSYRSGFQRSNTDTWGVTVDSTRCSVGLVVSESTQSLLAVYADTSYSSHYNGNNRLDWRYTDYARSLWAKGLRATVVTADSTWFYAIGVQRLNNLTYEGSWYNGARQYQAESGHYSEKDDYASGRVPTIGVIFLK